jgi:hypothetical protein
MSDGPENRDLARRDPDVPPWWETIVKAGLAAIPQIGGPLSVLVADVATRDRARVTEVGMTAVEAAGSPEVLLAAVQRDERVADLLVTAGFAASQTSVEGKRRAMGRVVGRAAQDDAAIDESQLMLRVLIDLDAPEFNVLARIADAGGDQDSARSIADGAPLPVASTLIRNGLVETVGTLGGGLAVVGLTPYGRSLLDFVQEGDVEPDA